MDSEADSLNLTLFNYTFCGGKCEGPLVFHMSLVQYILAANIKAAVPNHRATDWYRSVGHLVPVRGSFGTGPWVIWYRSVGHLVPVRGSFGTGPWVIWYRSVGHLVPVRGSFGTGPWVIWDRSVGHLVPVRGSFGTGPWVIWYRAAQKE